VRDDPEKVEPKPVAFAFRFMAEQTMVNHTRTVQCVHPSEGKKKVAMTVKVVPLYKRARVLHPSLRIQTDDDNCRLVAESSIDRFRVLFKETPLFVFRGFGREVTSESEILSSYATWLVAKCYDLKFADELCKLYPRKEEVREETMKSLMEDGYRPDVATRFCKVSRKLCKNAFGLNDETFLTYYGSFVNHSCEPNAHWVYNPFERVFTAIAMRDIAPGEDVTFDYLEAVSAAKKMTPLQRREFIADKLEFQCNCAKCSSIAT
jgi:hypothetical protein